MAAGAYTPAVIRRSALLLAASMMTACASSQMKTKTDPPPAPTPVPAARKLLSLPSGEAVQLPALLAAMSGARIVFVGEQHPSAHDHAVQLAVLEAMYAQDPSLGIGMEMVARPLQPVLDAFIAGEFGLSELPARLEWSKRWGYDFQLYAPIFAFAAAHHLPLYALNAPRGWSKQIARGGVKSLSAEDQAALPELDLGVGAHRAAVKAIFDAHMAGHGHFSFDNFYAAQVLWDETMADTAARALSAEGAPKRLLVLAGAGHISLPGAIPPRVARRGVRPGVAVIPFVPGDPHRDTLEELLTLPVDFIWMEPSAPAAAPAPKPAS